MIPVLEKTIEVGELTIFQTTDNRFGAGFELMPCDLEVDEPSLYQQKLLSFVRSVPTDAISRLKFKVEENKSALVNANRRKHAWDIGYSQKSVILFVELQGEPLIIAKIKKVFNQSEETEKSVESLKQIYNLAIQSGLNIKPLAEKETRNDFVDPFANWIKDTSSVSDGSRRIGVVRLNKPGQDELSEASLAEALKDLPRPFEISVTWQRKSPGKIRLDLERRLKQTETSQNPTEQSLYESTANALKESLNSGAQFIDYEFLVILERKTEAQLSNDLRLVKNKLSPLGDFQIETFGAAPSWLASLCGNSSHVTLREVDETFCLQLPVWHFGENGFPCDSLKALPFLRSDKSLYSFDLFNPEFSVYNSVIVGTSGRGKSVLTGLLSKALLNDPSVHVIKLDVGGSHSKECELFGGTEHVLELNKPSGINPFEIVYLKCSDAEKVGILSRFLGVLIQEQGELSFSKDLRALIEENIQSYLENYKNPTLQEFYELQTQFPRRNLLKRWVKGGIYEAAFAECSNLKIYRLGGGGDRPNQHERLRYYNFSQVFQASDPEFAQAGLAAVLAQFNMETLNADRNRIVLICDETPFFIKNCFEFFKFSTANVRKFGHAVVLLTQLSSDLVVNGDTGIIENSPQRFLFSVDGDENDYQSRFNLKNHQIETIRKLRSVPGELSEVFLQTTETGRKLQIKITKEEYWELTSNRQDQEKLNKLRIAVPELSLKEAIRCLSAV